MSVALLSAPPRRLVAVFLALTMAPAAGLVWLGWRLLWQDRALEAQRAQERCEHAADVVTGALEREIAAARQVLIEPDRAATPGSSPDAVVVVLRPQGVQAYPSDRLLFYPSMPSQARAEQDSCSEFLKGEEYEFQRQEYAKAIESFQPLAASRNGAVRAGAFLRIARNYRKAGEDRLALAAYGELARVERVAIGGVPSELIARGARCALLAEMQRMSELHQEAGALYEDLLGGRWRLTRPVYQLYAAQARRWIGQPDERERDQLALSDAAQRLWERWQASRAGDGRQPEATVLRLYDRCLTVLAQDSGETMAALIAGPQYLETHWLFAAARAIRDPNLRVYLKDAAGHTVNALTPADAGRRTVRLASDTGLPWTVVVADTAPQESEQLASRRQLLFTGLALAVILVLTSGYLTARAVTRELAVARLKSDFVSAVSHEFRTPLATLCQLTENLADGRVTTDERRNAYYQAQSRAANRLHRLVEGLLDFGRMEAGALRYRPELLDAGRITRSVVDEFEHVAATSGHEIRIAVEPGLPQVRADAEALGQAIWNLLDNAIKYSPGQTSISVEAGRENGFVAIRVRDRGLGIPARERKRLFRKFVRGSAAEAARVKGAGIGLAMVDYIVRAHGGRVRVESAPGEGSTFTLLLKGEAH